MEKRGGKASSLSETMSSTRGKRVCVVQGLPARARENVRDAQKRAGHVVSLAGRWGAMGIAGCWETHERRQNCRPMSGNVGL
jgi:hypothetical protein